MLVLPGAIVNSENAPSGNTAAVVFLITNDATTSIPWKARERAPASRKFSPEMFKKYG